MSNQGHLYINGQWQQGLGSLFQSFDNAKNVLLWQGCSANEQQVDVAVKSARTAFATWSQIDFNQRLAYVEKFAEQVKQHNQALALVIAQETGKPLWETATEAAAVAGKIALSLKAYQTRTGHTQIEMPEANAHIKHKPHGVVAVFGPYNFPAHLPNGHIVPALLAGNTVVFKPSELTPKTAEFMMVLWHQVGLPAGVINLVQGEVATGKTLAQHKGIDGLFFTGSSDTGMLLHQQFAGQPEKILALEMGGNNPLIVSEISNINAAVYTIIQSAFLSAGQRCTCARRLFIPNNSIGEQVLSALVLATQGIVVAEYDAQPQPFMGALISAKAVASILHSQQQLISQGGHVLVEAKVIKPNTALLSPGIIDVTDIPQLVDEEDFGPLLKVIRYDAFEQAITLANDTRFGLSAGLLSDNIKEWQLFYQQIRAGIVNWNKPITGASGAAPFGGIGLSGNHRASAYYAADYCAFPVASVESDNLTLPAQLSPGIKL